MGVSKKQSTPNFPKNEHFLPPNAHAYVCVSGGKKCSFFGKFDVLCFLETRFEICHLALFPAKFYSRNADFSSRKSGEEGDTCFLSRGTFEWGLEIFKVVDTKEDVMSFFKETFVWHTEGAP